MKIIIVKEKSLNKKLALFWVALNLCSPKGTIEIYEVMKAIENIVGKKKVMRTWRDYLRDEKKGIDWLKNELKRVSV